MPTVISLDLGTSKLCALALSVDARRALAVRSAPNDADLPDLPAGRHEQDPQRILERGIELVRELVADDAVAAEDVVGFCVTGQMHGLILVDGHLRPVTPLITWRDRRVLEPGPESDAESDGSGGGPVSTDTGCRLHPGYGGLALRWLAAGGDVPQGVVALSVEDYVTAALTGVVSTEPTHAASWGILDARERRWDRDTVARLGIPESVLPEVRPSAKPLGNPSAERAAALGLATSVSVCSPVSDNQASVVGAAGFGEGSCVVNLGTGGQVSIPSREFRFVGGLETRPMPFGGYILVGASLCGGWSYAYLRRFYQDVASEMTGREVTDAEAYERLNALAASAPPGAGGLTADTRFDGTRGEPDVRGAFTGIDAANLTPANLARALVEGMARELADMADLSARAGIASVVASGNAARNNPLVKQAIEQAFGVPCSVGPAREEAALGAAYCAAVGLGLLSTEEVNAAVAAPPATSTS